MKVQRYAFGASGNFLKIIAYIMMVADHVGLMIFPDHAGLRIIGRMSFPIFAYMIAEGCKYTRNPVGYFINVFSLGAACQVVYVMIYGEWLLGILITFSASILLIFSIKYFRKKSAWTIIIPLLLIVIISALQFGIPLIAPEIGFGFDYGIYGILLPVFIYCAPNKISKLIVAAMDLIMLSLTSTFLLQWYSLLSLIPLLFYNGKRGRLKMKYSFYILYPLQFIIIYLLA